MRFKFFPGSELSPPFMLGAVVDLDRPQSVLANIILSDENQLSVKPTANLAESQLDELMRFVKSLKPAEFKRPLLNDVFHLTKRRRAMC